MGDYLKLSVEEIVDGFVLRINEETPVFYKLSERETLWNDIKEEIQE